MAAVKTAVDGLGRPRRGRPVPRPAGGPPRPLRRTARALRRRRRGVALDARAGSRRRVHPRSTTRGRRLGRHRRRDADGMGQPRPSSSRPSTVGLTVPARSRGRLGSWSRRVRPVTATRRGRAACAARHHHLGHEVVGPPPCRLEVVVPSRRGAGEGADRALPRPLGSAAAAPRRRRGERRGRGRGSGTSSNDVIASTMASSSAENFTDMTSGPSVNSARGPRSAANSCGRSRRPSPARPTPARRTTPARDRAALVSSVDLLGRESRAVASRHGSTHRACRRCGRGGCRPCAPRGRAVRR